MRPQGWVIMAIFALLALCVAYIAMAYAGSPGAGGGGGGTPGPGPGSSGTPSAPGSSGSPSDPGGDAKPGPGVTIIGVPGDGCIVNDHGIRLCGPKPVRKGDPRP